jgi:hypothetical protein
VTIQQLPATAALGRSARGNRTAGHNASHSTARPAARKSWSSRLATVAAPWPWQQRWEKWPRTLVKIRAFEPTYLWLVEKAPKASVCDRSNAGIAGSNTAGGMGVCLLCCIIRSLCNSRITRPGESYRVCVCVCVCEWSSATTLYTWQWGQVEKVRIKISIWFKWPQN